MSVVAAVAAVALGVAFVVAGASKLAAGESWPVQAAGLGAPRWTVPVVPWVEMVVGALLIAQVRRGPALVAAGLLVVFTVMIVAKLRAGDRPACACFGAWSAKPIGVGHVVRNVVLLVIAGVAAI